MNVFALDNDPAAAAQAQCDRHVPKMLLESAQLLCGVFPPGAAPYRRTHYQHPCAMWTRAALGNFDWICRHALALADEYALRFGRQHASAEVVRWCRGHWSELLFAQAAQTPFAQAMPARYRSADAVQAYRLYYRGEKARFAAWNHGRDAPNWWH